MKVSRVHERLARCDVVLIIYRRLLPHARTVAVALFPAANYADALVRSRVPLEKSRGRIFIRAATRAADKTPRETIYEKDVPATRPKLIRVYIALIRRYLTGHSTAIA